VIFLNSKNKQLSGYFFTILLAWIVVILPMDFSVSAGESAAGNILKVCADPYMLPFSNKKEQGYENRIADLFAKKLGARLEYSWFPQRLGFIRNTLRKEKGTAGEYECDLVITAPEKFDLAATTESYYTTTYMLVYVKGRGLDEITDPQLLGKFVEEKMPELKFGLADSGPAQLWVFYEGLMGNMVPFQGQPGDPEVSPGQKMIEELVTGNIDATIIWGPTAGYYAKQYKDKADLVLLPLKDDPRNPEMKFKYRMAMAVRFGEKAWKEKINQLIKDNKKEIDKILTDYGVPLVE
jgi:quinoprotein dehydrogenase-associated probable ABC transporter substrate-binding protein